MNLRNIFFTPMLVVFALAARAQTNMPVAVQPPAAAQQQPAVLTFNDALRLTLRNDPRIASARSQEQIVGLDYKQSKRAIGPSLTFDGEYRINEGGDAADSFTSKFNPDEQWRGNFRITQSLFDARIKPAERRDKALWQASASDYTNTVRARLLLTGVMYFRAIQSQTILNVADQAKQLADLEVQRASLRVQAGEARQTDLLRAQVDQSRAERALNEARNDVVIAARELFRLCGIPAESTVNVQPPEPLPEPPTESLGDLVNLAYASRADIAAASNRIVAAKEQASIASRDRYPKFELVATETLASPDIYQKGNDTWDVLVVARFNLWDKGARSTKLLQDLERAEQTKQMLAQAAKETAGETDRALAALGVARLNLQTAQREETLAEQNYTILSEQAKNGLATALDVSTALVDLTRARMDKVRLQYDVEIAKLTLQAVTGQMAIPE